MFCTSNTMLNLAFFNDIVYLCLLFNALTVCLQLRQPSVQRGGIMRFCENKAYHFACTALSFSLNLLICPSMICRSFDSFDRHLQVEPSSQQTFPRPFRSDSLSQSASRLRLMICTRNIENRLIPT